MRAPFRYRISAGALLSLAVLLPQRLAAHEGHVHADQPPAVPAVPVAAATVIILPARVIADPRRSQLIAAPQAGTLIAPPGGYPLAGRQLAAGELLARLQPVLSSPQRRELEGQLVDARRDADIGYLQIDRYGIEAQTFDVSLPVQTLQIVTDYRAAQARRDQLVQSLSAPVAISTPRAGRLLRVEAANGRQYAAGEPLFLVQTDDALAIEARHVDAAYSAPEQAVALLDDGRELPLRLLGQGYDSARRVEVLRYALQQDADADLAINQRLRIRLLSPAPLALATSAR